MNPNLDPNMSFDVEVASDRRIDLKIYVSRLKAHNLDLTPWASTYVLASLLHGFDIEPPEEGDPDIPILELGAGIGLVGMAAAIVWHRHVILTDLEPIVPGLMKNIELNTSILQEFGGSGNGGALDWDNPDDLVLSDGQRVTPTSRKASIVIASDVVYSEDHPPSLSQAVLRWLAPGPKARFIMTLALRVAYLDFIRELWELLEKGGLECIRNGQEEARGDAWDDEKLCEWSIWKWRDT